MEDNKIQEMVANEVRRQLSFQTRTFSQKLIGDTPTDDLQLVNKKYVDAHGSSPGGSDTQVQFNFANTFGGIPSATYNYISSVLTLTTPTITKPFLDATNPTAQTYSPSAGATVTLDLSLANEHRIQMPAGNINLAISNVTLSQKFMVTFTQDSGGSRTTTWFNTIRWAGGVTPTLTTTANKRDSFGFVRTGSSTYDGFVIGLNI